MQTGINWHRGIYTLFIYIVAPLVPFYLLWRARRQPDYAQGWLERFAWYYSNQKPPTTPERIWIHAVSLGETRALEPLIAALFMQKSHVHIVLTHTTPTAKAEGKSLFSQYLRDGRMTQVYVPYDLPDVLTRFLKYFSPSALWLIETEIWPNMIAACVKHAIPVSLINGRLSDKTRQNTLKNRFVAELFKKSYEQLTHVCAQADHDFVNYVEVGVPKERLFITGNLKFDVSVPKHQVQEGLELRNLNRSQEVLPQRLIILLASTRDGEEQIWLDSLTRINLPNIQWWIIPRHPQRFSLVEELLERAFTQKNAVLKKTKLNQLNDESSKRSALKKANVVLGDTMGEMFTYYASADIVLMGGAWLPLGGQNFLEPLALGKPTLIGPHTFNFAQATNDAIQANALIQLNNMDEALIALQNMTREPEQLKQQQLRAKQFVTVHRGAVQKTLEILI